MEMIENHMVVDDYWECGKRRRVYCTCYECGEDIEYGDRYYRVNEENYCSDCVETYIAED